jgi:uncharacterized damage-inducible protein DinB
MSEISELMERFRRGPELMAVVLTGLGVEEQDYLTGPDKWSIRQIVAHVADSEVVTAHRLRQIVAEDNPTIIAYNQEAWARNLDYARRKPAASLETFRRTRAENYELIKGLHDAVFERTGNHTVRGPVTLRSLLELFTDHAEKHTRQVQAIRDQYKQQRSHRVAVS